MKYVKYILLYMLIYIMLMVFVNTITWLSVDDSFINCFKLEIHTICHVFIYWWISLVFTGMTYDEYE